jgi:hypothetical protein
MLATFRPIAWAAMTLAGTGVAATAAFAHEAPRGDTVQVQMHDPANCYCRTEGRTFAVGETACLRTPAGPRLAQCGMVLNNTSWEFSERACPES